MTDFKMKLAATWVVIVMSLCAMAAGAQQQPAGQDNVRVIQLTARKFEFSPNEVEVAKGDHVKLVITAVDRDHGFSLPAFGIKERLKKGVPTTIEFDANQAGTFPFRCSVFCGMGHSHMKGELVVKAD